MISSRLVGFWILSLGFLVWALSVPDARAGESPKAPSAGGAPVLDLKKSMWRFQLVRETAEILTEPGKVEKVVYWPKKGLSAGKSLDVSDCTVEKAKEYRLPESTPAGWAKPDFDDSQWWRGAGPPEFAMDEGWKLILARGRFEVADPAACQALTLFAAYRGGIVVYLNGEEVARKDLMAGQTGIGALAEPYPEAAHTGAGGAVLDAKGFAGKAEFNRRLEGCQIPAEKLRKGENILAVEVHRAPLDKICMLRGSSVDGRTCFSKGWLGLPVGWSPVGLAELTLSAPAGGALTPATGPARLQGLRLWNQAIVQAPLGKDPGGALAALAPVKLVAPRGGAGSGLVLAGSSGPIKGLKVEAGELKGPGTIPASALQVRYALPEGRSDAPTGFDALAEAAPSPVPALAETGLAVQPLWISVAVPADAAPGDYSGALTVSAEGAPPQAVQLKLRVSAWKLPALGEGAVHNDFMQSPESLAMRYGVELWSEEHLKLLDRTFAMIAPLGCRTLYVTAIRRTHLGNEHAMVLWVRGKDGALEPDLSIVEKYVDVAAKRLGKIPSVVLYAWEAPDTQGHAGNPNAPSRTHDRPILLTLRNPKTGELREILGPDWGTPESQELWGKLIPAMQKLLKDRGMEKSLVIGLIGDHRPTKQAMSEFAAAGPGVLFAAHSHFYCAEHYGHKVGVCSSVWGVGCGPTLPEFGPAGHGWKSDFRLTLNSRYGLAQTAPPNIGMNLAEKWMAASAQVHGGKEGAANDGVKGLGRIGVDFWPVFKDSRGNWRGQLCGRYPETYWGQLSLLCCTQWLLAPGPNGPISTIRAEAMREGAQAMEARVVIDRALVDKAQRAKLGEELAARAARFMEDRQRLVHFAEGWQGAAFAAGVDWPEQTERLYRLAGEVAEKIGK
ncbi:MAG TPA: DUF6067 family protein [Planctomycetota bacterium]|nr:DUF6067 family protein [Planctomycetota bacterium]